MLLAAFGTGQVSEEAGDDSSVLAWLEGDGAAELAAGEERDAIVSSVRAMLAGLTIAPGASSTDAPTQVGVSIEGIAGRSGSQGDQRTSSKGHGAHVSMIEGVSSLGAPASPTSVKDVGDGLGRGSWREDASTDDGDGESEGIGGVASSLSLLEGRHDGIRSLVDVEARHSSLDDVAPALKEKVERVVQRMREEFGHAVTVVESYRTPERQAHLYAQGRSRPGPVVTWTTKSLHSEGRAVDVMVDEGYGNELAYQRLQAIAREEGLDTLGAKDAGHLQLPEAKDGGAAERRSRGSGGHRRARGASARGARRQCRDARAARGERRVDRVRSRITVPGIIRSGRSIGCRSVRSRLRSDGE
jgi:hypothetical protein